MRLIANVVVCLLFAFPVFAETDPVALAAQFGKLSVGSAVAVTNFTLTSGRLRVTFASGGAAPLKAGEDVVGVFVKGDGKFTYTTDDRVEFPAIRTNLKKLHAKAGVDETPAGMTISGNVEDMLWMTSPASVPALASGAATSVGADFSANRAIFDQQLTDRSIRMAAQRLNAPASKLVIAEFRGSDDWTYQYDDVSDSVETLSQLYTLDFLDRKRRSERFAAVVAEEPIGHDRKKGVRPPVSMTALDFTMTAEDNNVGINALEEFTPAVAGMRVLPLEVYGSIYDDKGRIRSLNVRSAKTVDGKDLPFVSSDGFMMVALPEPSVAGKPVKIRFELDGDILIRASGDNFWLLDGPWYPQTSHAGLAHTVHATVKTKAPFMPFTGGKSVRRGVEDGYNVIETVLDQPVSHIAVLAGKYSFDEETRDGLTIRTASYAMKNTAGIKKLTNLAFQMIAFYKELLGPFPLTEYNIVEINDFGWGQAPAGLMFITSEAFQPMLGLENQLYSQGVNERFAHEIAHQYWGTKVRWAGWDEQWLSESFAEYSAGLLLKTLKSEGSFLNLMNTWRANARLAANSAPIPLAYRLVDPGGYNWNRVYLLYAKGPLLLAALHKDVGDKNFVTFMRSYQKTFQQKLGATEDVPGLMGFIMKKDYKPFFDTYYWGTAVPEVK